MRRSGLRDTDGRHRHRFCAGLHRRHGTASSDDCRPSQSWLGRLDCSFWDLAQPTASGSGFGTATDFGFRRCCLDRHALAVQIMLATRTAPAPACLARVATHQGKQREVWLCRWQGGVRIAEKQTHHVAAVLAPPSVGLRELASRPLQRTLNVARYRALRIQSAAHVTCICTAGLTHHSQWLPQEMRRNRPYRLGRTHMCGADMCGADRAPVFGTGLTGRIRRRVRIDRGAFSWPRYLDPE